MPVPETNPEPPNAVVDVRGWERRDDIKVEMWRGRYYRLTAGEARKLAYQLLDASDKLEAE